MNKRLDIIPKKRGDIRAELGYTQKIVGVEIGLDESVARSRISHYEKGIHAPDYKSSKSKKYFYSTRLPYYSSNMKSHVFRIIYLI